MATIIFIISIAGIVAGAMAGRHVLRMEQANRELTVTVLEQNMLIGKTAGELEKNLVILEWECRDLTKIWLRRFPYIAAMPPARQYGEWVTFVGNCGDRESVLRLLDRDSVL